MDKIKEFFHDWYHCHGGVHLCALAVACMMAFVAAGLGVKLLSG